MANELEHLDATGLTIYAKPLPIVASPWGDDAVAMTETGTTGYYSADVASPANRYAVYQQTGASPAATDVAVGVITVVVTADLVDVPNSNAVGVIQAGLATSGQVSDLADAVAGIGGNGDGDTPVDHNWAGSFTVNGGESQEGGDDSLLITSSQGAVDGATIRAYVANDYDAGRRTVNAQTSTGSDGRWVAPLMLDPDDYVIVISKPGVMVTTLIRLTVE